jgi:hypothetical protein
MKRLIPLICLCFVIAGFELMADRGKHKKVSVPEAEAVSLRPYSRMKFPQISESSGLVRSRVFQDVYWTHNDSGDLPRIFPVTRTGDIIKSRWMVMYNGIMIEGAENVDWEDITADNLGNLWIGDIGNNNRERKNFTIYIIREPPPLEASSASISRKIEFYYPDKKKSSKRDDINAEAIFWADRELYILTKRDESRRSKLYRLESQHPDKKNKAELEGSFDFNGAVTGADAAIDGTMLAVLTYSSVWLFKVREGSSDFFSGTIFWLPIIAGQAEGICIDDENLLISNEYRELFEISVDDMILIRE